MCNIDVIITNYLLMCFYKMCYVYNNYQKNCILYGLYYVTNICLLKTILLRYYFTRNECTMHVKPLF